MFSVIVININVKDASFCWFTQLIVEVGGLGMASFLLCINFRYSLSSSIRNRNMWICFNIIADLDVHDVVPLYFLIFTWYRDVESLDIIMAVEGLGKCHSTL